MVQTNGRVSALVTIGQITYLGGSFTAVRPAGVAPGEGLVPRSHLAAVDNVTGKLVAGWDPGADDEVDALAVSPNGQTIYAGGLFNELAGQARRRIGALRAATGVATDFQSNLVGEVDSLAASAGTVYIGGLLISLDGQPRHGAAAVDARTGALLPGWAPMADDRVRAVALSPDGTTVYLGGEFLHINGKAPRHLAKVSATDATVLPFASVTGYPVWSVAVTVRSVFVGGNGTGGHAAAYSTSGTPTWLRQTDGGVQAIALMNGVLYVGGHFDKVCVGQTSAGNQGFHCPTSQAVRHKLLAFDPKSGDLSTWAPNANSNLGVFAMFGTGSVLVVGGDFTALGHRGTSALIKQQGFGAFPA